MYSQQCYIHIKNNKTYAKIKLISVEQRNKKFYVSSLPSQLLINTFIVSPSQYDISLESKELALGTEDKFLIDARISEINELRKDLKDKGYQREVDESRVSMIKDFLIKDPVPVFPNSIIVTASLLNDKTEAIKFDDVPDEIIIKYDNFVFLEENDDSAYLYIPNTKDTILVVDGQHRIEGIKSAGETFMSQYEVLVTFALGYDRPEIASLFYTINHEQTKVNKSVLYHLKSEFSRELNELTVLHEIVKILNEATRSPLYSRIKMLGKTQPNLPQEQRMLMTVSQAFLIDSLKYTLAAKTTKSQYLPIFRYFYLQNQNADIAVYIATFFKSVRKLRADWDSPDKSQISKTLGIGALLKVLNFIFIEQFIDYDFASKPDSMNSINEDIMSEYLTGIENVDLSSFQGSTSAGALNILKDMIIGNLPRIRQDKVMISTVREWISRNI